MTIVAMILRVCLMSCLFPLLRKTGLFFASDGFRVTSISSCCIALSSRTDREGAVWERDFFVRNCLPEGFVADGPNRGWPSRTEQYGATLLVVTSGLNGRDPASLQSVGRPELFPRH